MKKKTALKAISLFAVFAFIVCALAGCSLFPQINEVDDIGKRLLEWVDDTLDTEPDPDSTIDWNLFPTSTETTAAQTQSTTETAAVQTQNDTETTQPAVQTTQPVIKTTAADNGGDVEDDYDIYCYYYSQLSNTEKAIYLGVLETVQKGDEWASFSGVDTTAYSKACNRAVKALVYDHRELFEYGGGWSYQIRGKTFYLSPSKYDYWEYNTSTDKQKKAFESKTDAIVKEIRANCSDKYEMAKYAHNYLIKNSIYDTKAADDVKNHPTSYNISNQQIFTAYGCIANGKCVCAGYAAAYKVILDRLGIKCVYVVGKSQGVGHAWNRIILDGENYYIDVTWDDTMAEVFDSSGNLRFPEATLFKYFNITTNELITDHDIDDTFVQPSANGTKYNYFLYSGYYLEEYDLDTFISMVEAQKDEGSVNIKFKNPAEVALAEKEFVKDGGYKAVDWLDGFSYIFDDEDGYAVILYK